MASLPPIGQGPTLQERLELARSCMIIARAAGAARHDVHLAKREVARARSEIAAVTRVLDGVRVTSLLLQGRANPRILRLLDLSRRIGDELRSASTGLSRLN